MDYSDNKEQNTLPSEEIEKILEMALLVSGQPLSLASLKQMFENSLTSDDIKKSLFRVKESWQERALSLIETASGYQFISRSEYIDYIHRLNPQRQPRLSKSLLEVLSIIVYYQPVTRGDIEKIRGTTVSSSQFAFLEEMGWIEEVGQRETPGRPMLYATTKTFIDDLGLKNLDDLPSLETIEEGNGIGDDENNQLILNMNGSNSEKSK